MRSKSRQQAETASYFNDKARSWYQKAEGVGGPRVNVIAQRNAYVVHVAKGREGTRHVLDVGCGVGDLACELARGGADVLGIDFAEDMISLAQDRVKKEKLSGVKFVTADFFDLGFGLAEYDLIAANGFIEYISYKQRDFFLETAHRILTPGGSLVISSRNRLFNVFSMNVYTEQEIRAGVADSLLREAVVLAGGGSAADLVNFTAAPLQDQSMLHEHTGIGVGTRYQYTPAQLVQVLAVHGFRTENMSPIHIHGAVPAFKKRHPKVHVRVAEEFHRHALHNTALLPNASAFMIHARRA